MPIQMSEIMAIMFIFFLRKQKLKADSCLKEIRMDKKSLYLIVCLYMTCRILGHSMDETCSVTSGKDEQCRR